MYEELNTYQLCINVFCEYCNAGKHCALLEPSQADKAAAGSMQAVVCVQHLAAVYHIP